jgi:hypothetical protein
MQRMLMEYLVNSLWQTPLLALGAWLVLRAARPGLRVQHGAWVGTLALIVLLPLLSLRAAGDGVAQMPPQPLLPQPTALAAPQSASLPVPPQASLQRVAEPGQSASAAPPAPKASYEYGIEILSNTEGVEEFMGYISRLSKDLKRNWEPVIPAEVRAPLFKKGVVGIRLTILPDGSIAQPMFIETRSGDVALDKAAWFAITSEGKFAPLPKEFHGPNLELRIGFFYNTPVPEGREGGEPRGPTAQAPVVPASSRTVAVREVSFRRASAAAQGEASEAPAASVDFVHIPSRYAVTQHRLRE